MGTGFQPPQSTRPRLSLQTSLIDKEGFPSVDFATHLGQLGDLLADGPVIYDTHAARINATPSTLPFYGPGRYLRYLFVETDRNFAVYFAYVNTSSVTPPAWQLLFGQMLVTNLSNLPSDLGGHDAGMLVYDANLKHNYRWTGAVWQFAPGDPGAGFIVPSLTAAGPPNGGVWQLCDGTTVTVSKGDGTTENVTTPNLCGTSSTYFISASNAASGLVGTTAPTYVGGPTVTTGADSGGATVQSGTGATVAQSGHTHSVTVPNINPPSVPNGGLPNHASFLWYLRV